MVVLCALDPFNLIQRIFHESSLKFVPTFDDLQSHQNNNVFLAESEEKLLELLSANTEASLGILIPPTELLISEALSSSGSLKLEHVSDTLSRALKLQTQNRLRISFIPLCSICGTDSEILDITVQFDVTDILANIYSQQLLLSNYVLYTNAELKKLDKRIKASLRFPHKDILPTVDVEEVIERKQKEKDEKQQLAHDNAKLVDEILSVQEALEVNISRLEVEEERFNELKRQSVTKETSLKQVVDEQCKALDFSVEALLTTQEELEIQVVARKSLSSDLAQAEKAHKKSKNQAVKLKDEFEKLEELYNRERSAHEKLKQEHKQKCAKYAKSIAKLERQLEDKARELKEKSQSLTLFEKQKDRELIKLEAKISEQEDIAHELRTDLAKYRVATMSPYWRLSQKFEKLSHLLDRKATDRNQQLLDASLIYTSDLFDAKWYLETYKDVAAVGIEPMQHYLSSGASEGRNPSSRFDGNWYLQRYPDVAETGMNPLLHYIKHGREEGRSISPLMISHERRKSK
ncbi:hypothetical protein [Alteromonas lipotrueae]|uniref:hypothetical protein n=1 Tax=Alteromonas lipotrueae TaxID=2803814 RepID=UPI001C486821|nr:hypothetical protein [Alteromonas lipotrueae]